MSRIIQTDGIGKRRNQLLRGIVISIRELMKQQVVDSSTRDLAAFISNALLAVHETVDLTVGPWEKRGYWVKADKFRLEWAWTQEIGTAMLEATKNEDWATIAAFSAQTGQRLSNIKVSDRHRMGKPWVGAWDRMFDSENES